MNWNRVMILGAAFLLPVLVWVVIGWYAADTWQGFGVCVGSAVLGGVLLTALATQAIAQGRASGILIAAVVLLNVVLPIVALALDASPSAAAMTSPQPVVRPFTTDEWEGLHTVVLTDPVVSNQWTVSPEETDIRVDRKISQPQLLLNLGFMDELEMEQTSGSKNWPLFDASFDGSDWRYLAPYYTGEGLPDGAQALFLRTNQRYPPGQYDEYVDFHLRVKSHAENQLVIRTEREIRAGTPAAWGKVPTVHAGRPLQWELRVYLSRKDGGLFDQAVLKQIPIVVGWLDKEDLLDETRLPLRASNARLATSSLVVFRHDSVQVAGNKTLVVFVPAEFKEDIWCRVNLKIW